jgi:ABC-type Mn2+/Zn2+ transport system permease subunit
MKKRQPLEKEVNWMEELWLIITLTVGILAVIAAALLTKKKQKFWDDSLSTLAIMTLVIGLVFGGTDQLLGQSLIWLSLLLAIISAAKGLSQK